MTATARPWNVGTSTALPISAHGTTVVNEETGLASQLPSVPTAMVAAQERSSVVEQRTPNAPVGGSNPSVPANVEQWRGLVESIFPAFAVETALRIMRCESGGNPNATGAAGERGLFQVHGIHHDSTYDPTGNVLAAFRISAGGTNWNPWSCS
jgi:hypothetical protein